MKPFYLQIVVFFTLVGLGFGLGVLFDMYRITRAILRPGRRGTQAGDLLFWLVVTGLVLFLLFTGNWGDFRFFVLLALALGAGLYFPLASRTVLKILVVLVNVVWRIARWVRKTVRFIWRCLMVPVVWVLMVVGIPLRFIRYWKRRVKLKMRRKRLRLKRRIRRRIRAKLAALKNKILPPKKEE